MKGFIWQGPLSTALVALSPTITFSIYLGRCSLQQLRTFILSMIHYRKLSALSYLHLLSICALLSSIFAPNFEEFHWLFAVFFSFIIRVSLEFGWFHTITTNNTERKLFWLIASPWKYQFKTSTILPGSFLLFCPMFWVRGIIRDGSHALLIWP
jgi:hypothetical protein